MIFITLLALAAAVDMHQEVTTVQKVAAYSSDATCSDFERSGSDSCAADLDIEPDYGLFSDVTFQVFSCEQNIAISNIIS